MTLSDTIFFLQEGLTVGGKGLKDFLDAENHSETINYLMDVVKNDISIDCHLLRSMNNLLLRRIHTVQAIDIHGSPFRKTLNAGEYKKEPDYVVKVDGTIHEYSEPHLVEGQLMELCDWIDQSQHHPVVTASVAHYNMVRIHPFQDGNGRGARLLMNLILMKEEYTPAVIEIEKRDEYLLALKEADEGSLIPFIDFVADSVIKTQETVSAEIDKYLAEKDTSRIPYGKM